MKTSELSQLVGQKTGIQPYIIRKVIRALSETAFDNLAPHKPVVKMGALGTFELKYVKARAYRHLKTKELMIAPARWTVTFKMRPSKRFPYR